MPESKDLPKDPVPEAKSPSRSSQTLIPRTSMTCKTSQRNKTRFMVDLTIRKREILTATPVAASSGGRSGGSLICNRRQALQRVEPRHCCCWRVYSLSVSPSLCLCVSLALLDDLGGELDYKRKKSAGSLPSPWHQCSWLIPDETLESLLNRSTGIFFVVVVEVFIFIFCFFKVFVVVEIIFFSAIS